MEKKRKIREAVNVEYDDGLREAITAKRLSNTDLIGWIDTGFNKSFLVFRSIERADPKERADQSWFDSLTQDSALAVVEKSLALNHSPELQKKSSARRWQFSSRSCCRRNRVSHRPRTPGRRPDRL